MNPPHRLLFLLPFPPRLDAADGGSRALAQFLVRLAPFHQLALLYFRAAQEPPLDDVIGKQCSFIAEVERPYSGNAVAQRVVRSGRLALSLLQRKPMWATDWTSKRYGRRLTSLIQSWQPEIIHAVYSVMGQYVCDLRGCQIPRIVTSYEVGMRAAPYLRAIQPPLADWIHAMDQWAWSRFEPHMVRGVQATVVLTEQDRQAVAALAPDANVLCIRLGTVLSDVPLNPCDPLPPTLLFVGSFVHPPNVEAAIRLVFRIFPTVQRAYPQVKLNIVGPEPPPRLKGLSDNNILVTGHVRDLNPYLTRATLFVAPLVSGGGMRVKIMEALAYGMVIVASHRAVEGLDVSDGEELCLAETDEDFVEQIKGLLSDDKRRSALAQRARLWAEQHLTWDEPVQAYEALYQQLLSAPTQ